jgi:hypothetical protein
VNPRRRGLNPDFARSIRRADRLQPALLVATIVSTPGFAISASGPEATLAFVAAGGYTLRLARSGDPRAHATAADRRAASVEDMLRRR